jgi:hypothetical protein
METTKIHKTLHLLSSLSTTPQLEKNWVQAVWGAVEKMGEVPGPRAEGCARQVACPLKLDLLPLTNSNYYISSDNRSFTHTIRWEHSMSWIVAEGDSSLTCRLTKLVEWETRVVALKRYSSFAERVGFFEVFLFAMCSHKISPWLLNMFQK